ncbi:MAG TPA: PAS domain S-box protein, partial [Dokdonella sp.]
MADETNEADSGGKPDPNDVAALHRRIAALERELARRSGDDHGDADALRELGLRLADELDPERIAHAAVEVAAALTGAAPAVFLRAADGDAGHVLVAGAGAAADAIAAFAAPEHAALFAPTLRGDPHAPASGAPTRSLLAAAVKARSGVHGGLFLGHVDPGVFGAREQCLLAGIAAQAALALDRAREVTAGEHAREELARLADSFEQRVDERIDALRRHELRFQQLISGIADYAIFLLDAEGRVMTWNTGAERITGYSAAEAVGRDFSQFYTPEDRAAGEPQRALRVAAERGKYEAEAWRVRKDGTRFIANVLLDAIRDGGGRVVGFAKVTRDMTERRAMEERLRQSQKVEAIGQLTGGVAHDFNNLLTVIIGNLETICRRSVDDARLRHAADQAMRAAQRAAALTQQLLAFSRRQPLNPKPVDMNRLVASMSDLLRRTLGERIVIETVLAGGLWSAEVDVHQLENALLNLAVNARDAMPRGGRLTIETANAHIDASAGGEYADLGPGDYVMIRVGDSGIGMSKDVLEHAFEPFFTTKPIGQGTGLGLSQVYGFVTQSGGHVKIHSVPGEGTSIRIYLPRASTPAVTEPAAAPAATPRGSETILVVEDDGDVRLFGVETLRDLGFAVLDAPDGPSALKLLEQHPEIDLLFTDVG